MKRSRFTNTKGISIMRRSTAYGTKTSGAIRNTLGDKRRKSKDKNPIVAKSIVPFTETSYQYTVYFNRFSGNRGQVENAELLDYIKTGMSGRYKICFHPKPTYMKRQRYINKVYLTDESDLFLLSLCHRDNIRKIYRMEDTKVESQPVQNSTISKHDDDLP